MKQPELEEFNRNQIKRVYDLYASTVSLKKFIATSIVAKIIQIVKIVINW